MKINETKNSQASSEVRSGCPDFPGYDIVVVTDYTDGTITKYRVKAGEEVDPNKDSPIE